MRAGTPRVQWQTVLALFSRCILLCFTLSVTGGVDYGFWLATTLAALLFAGLMFNWLLNPTRAVLEQLDVTEYRQDATA